MNDLAVSDINSHMACIADNIARLRLGVADPYARRPLLSGSPGNRNSEMLVNALDKTGAVRAVG